MPGGDGKAIGVCSGLGGAYCTCCTATKKEGSDPLIARNGYVKNRSRDQNLQLYNSLKKKRDGTINTTVSSNDRLGMTQPPIGRFLDWTEAMNVLHNQIRDLTDYLRLAMFLYARESFPDEPIMDGSGFPVECHDEIVAKLKEAKTWIRNEAKKPPLAMFLMMPDPHGTGKVFNFKNFSLRPKASLTVFWPYQLANN